MFKQFALNITCVPSTFRTSLEPDMSETHFLLICSKEQFSSVQSATFEGL